MNESLGLEELACELISMGVRFWDRFIPKAGNFCKILKLMALVLSLNPSRIYRIASGRTGIIFLSEKGERALPQPPLPRN
jgi:hypothetical protein